MRMEILAAVLLVGVTLLQAAAVNPPVGAINPGRRITELGFEDRFITDAGWRAEGFLVPKPDSAARLTFNPAGAHFSVATANAAMAWTRTAMPVWSNDFPWVYIEYTLDAPATDKDAELLLNDDATGPVTPGANNPENPQAVGGQVRISLPPGKSPLVLDLRTVFKSDRVTRMSFLLRAQKSPARLHVKSLSFWSTDPRARNKPATTMPTLMSDGSKLSGDWQPLDLPGMTGISADVLGAIWPAQLSLKQSGIIFRLNPEIAAAVATSIPDDGIIELTGQWQGSELALLLAARTFGTEARWPATGPAAPRPPITSPHSLLVRLEYSDGSRRSHFPWSVARQNWSVDRSPGACIVPLDATKTLTRIRIEEKMEFGQAILLAASVNRAKTPAFNRQEAASYLTAKRIRPPATRPAKIVVDQGVCTIETSWLKLVGDLRTGFLVRELSLPSESRTVITSTNPRPLVYIFDAQAKLLPQKLVSASASPDQTSATLHWTIEGGPEVKLKIEATPDGQLRFAPTLTNKSAAPWTGTVWAPHFQAAKIAENPADRWHFLGTRDAALANTPVKLELAYADVFPHPLMDLFAPAAGGGIGMLVEDEQLVRKYFHFEQDDTGARMYVVYSHCNVAPGEPRALPSTLLFAHAGDWRDAYDRYRESLRAPELRTGDRMKDLFYCRRDYPIGGTGYLFDQRANLYTPERLIEESKRGFAGIDMIDISGWAFHEKTGRVGDYRTNDLGGLTELHRAIQVAHEKGVKVGLYFEGYLIDQRTPLAKETLPKWQIIHKDGKPYWWPGDMEFFACPGVEARREEFSTVVADVAAETGADAVYVDQFGNCGEDKVCYAPDHGHAVPSNPLVEESRLLSMIREKLKPRTPNCGIYIEYVPADRMMRYIDGAFAYGMVENPTPQHVTKLPLTRFLFPQFAHVEMVNFGLKPTAAREDDLHRCLFSGVGFWLKGRSESWYSPGFRELAQRAAPVLKAHGEIFRTGACEPLIPTLTTNVFANRFATDKAILLTVYNARHEDIRGKLLKTAIPAGWKIDDLLAQQPATTRPDGDGIILSGSLEPMSTGIYLAHP